MARKKAKSQSLLKNDLLNSELILFSFYYDFKIILISK